MKKFFLSLALTSLSFAALAQHESNIDHKIEMRSRALNDLMNQRMYSRLEQPAKVELLRMINLSIKLLDNPYNPAPNPMPVPGPVPTPTPTNLTAMVTIMVESTAVTFNAMGSGDVYTQCMNSPIKNMSGVDEVLVSVGNSKIRSFTTNNWFNTMTICNSAAEAFTTAISPFSMFHLNVAGSIENTAFNFTGMTKASILSSCANVAKNMSGVDEITVFVNNSSAKRISTNNWFTPNAMCRGIMNQVDVVVP